MLICHLIASADLNLSPIANHLFGVWLLLYTTVKIVANITDLRRIIAYGHANVFLVDFMDSVRFVVLRWLLIGNICLTH